jgi:hypothetical protein
MSTTVQSVRGSFTLEDMTPVADVHPGSTLVITDTATGASGSYRISGIAKRVLPTMRQDWTISYGADAPSYVDARGR